MLIELTVINQLPLPETGKSIARYVPFRIHQKKLFMTENLHVEQCASTKGQIIDKYSIAKYDGEYYKLNIPYKELRDDYFLPIQYKGLGK